MSPGSLSSLDERVDDYHHAWVFQSTRARHAPRVHIGMPSVAGSCPDYSGAMAERILDVYDSNNLSRRVSRSVWYVILDRVDCGRQEVTGMPRQVIVGIGRCIHLHIMVWLTQRKDIQTPQAASKTFTNEDLQRSCQMVLVPVSDSYHFGRP